LIGITKKPCGIFISIVGITIRPCPSKILNKTVALLSLVNAILITSRAGFGNIATTVAYLQNLKNALGEETKTDIQKTV